MTGISNEAAIHQKVNAPEIILRVPARSSYRRVVQVGAGSLARRHGLADAALHDLQKILDEALDLLLCPELQGSVQPAAGDAGEIVWVFRLGPETFQVRAERSDAAALDAAAVARFDEFAAGLAVGLLGNHEIDPRAGRLRLELLHRG